MSDLLLKDIQKVDLKIFKEYKRLCEKYELSYFAIGGTCIGAVRHGGFIPWDDDIDVAMPFEDYNRFRSIAEQELSYPYAVYDQHKNKHTSHLFLKIHDESTAFIPKNCIKLYDRYMGISLDVMPIYGMPDDAAKQEQIMRRCKKYRINNRMLRMPITIEPSLKMKVLWVLRAPLRLALPFDYFGKKQEIEFGRYDFNNSDFILFGWRSIPSRSRFFKEDFIDYVEFPFEDTSIRVPVGYDRYLKMDFGDYMTLPPLSEQKSTHIPGIVDVNTSYKYYLKRVK